MNRLFILLFLLTADILAVAQTDTALRVKKTTIKSTTTSRQLTDPQKKWLNSNYKQIAGLKKDSAAANIRKSFTSISEASVEYLISQATKLQQDDNQQQLALLKQMLDQLKMEKQAISKKIQEKEGQLTKTTDAAKKQAIANDILELKKKLAQADDTIRAKREAIRQIEAK